MAATVGVQRSCPETTVVIKEQQLICRRPHKIRGRTGRLGQCTFLKKRDKIQYIGDCLIDITIN